MRPFTQFLLALTTCFFMANGAFADTFSCGQNDDGRSLTQVIDKMPNGYEFVTRPYNHLSTRDLAQQFCGNRNIFQGSATFERIHLSGGFAYVIHEVQFGSDPTWPQITYAVDAVVYLDRWNVAQGPRGCGEGYLRGEQCLVPKRCSFLSEDQGNVNRLNLVGRGQLPLYVVAPRSCARQQIGS
jgi:hypothetical protein